MKFWYYIISFFTTLFLCIILISCSNSDLKSFQTNEPTPPYNLLHIFDNYPSLNEVIDNLETQSVNSKLADFIINGTDLDILCINASNLLSDQSTSFTVEIAELLDIIINEEIRYCNNPSDQGFYANSNIQHEQNFYRAMDVILDNSDISVDLLKIGGQLLRHIKEKDPGNIEQTIGDAVDDFSSPDFKNDCIDVSKKLSRILITNDYPIWLDSDGTVITSRKSIDPKIHTNTDMGNLVKGIITIVTGLNELSSRDAATREILYDAIREDVRSLIKSDASKQVIKDTVQNLAYYFSAGGDGYNTSDYHSDSNGVYVNTELKDTIKEIFPGLVKLFIRNDSAGTAIPDYSIANDTKGQSPLEAFTCSLAKLKEAGIDYSHINLESSLRRMIDYNAWGKKRTDAGTTKVTFLDHFLYAIVTAAKFGFLSRQSSDGEPSENSGHGHGIATNGVLTVNDVIYAIDMSTGDLGWLSSICTSMNLYDMALDDRVGQANNISRSANSFASTEMASHKFYMGADYPIASLVPSACAGDAGLPNGGENAITPTSNSTTVSTKTSVSQNDYRTYFPRVADGLGAVNTAEFLLSLIPRACWDGAGPFYFAPGNAETKAFNWPGKGWRTVNVYYKPNGEIYAYVNKPSSSAATWDYYYPVSGNDIADATGQRSNRYMDKIESDYYLVKYRVAGITYYAVPPVNPNGSDYALSSNKFVMKMKTGSNAVAQNFVLEEKYKQTDPRRECKSQEEAMYRNFQWLCFDKKLSFIIPLYVKLISSVGEVGGYLFAEGNGFLGLVNSRKGPQNGYWLSNESDFPIAKYANSGIGIGNITTSNNPDYMESHIPGDGRLTLLLSANLYPLVTPDLMFNGLIGTGYAFPGAIACSIPTVLRLGFLQEEMVEANSTDIGNTSSETWNNRNKLLPLIVALTGSLRDITEYKTSASGYNYNYRGKHKLPISELLEGVLVPLAKPHLRYMEDLEHASSDTAYWGKRWMQRVENESAGVFSCFTTNIVNETSTDYFSPRQDLRSLISILAGKEIATSDGLIPLITDNTKLLSRMISLLQNAGSSGMASARKNLFVGLEQLLTSIKAGTSETMTRNITLLDYTPYAWMFTPREEDLLLDDMLVYDGPVLPDDQRWEDFDSSLVVLKEFLDGEKDVTSSIINIMDAVLRNQLTASEIESLIYTAGKVFGRYTDNEWRYHGESSDYDAIYKLLTYLPAIHAVLQDAGSGNNYTNIIDNLLWLLENDSSLLYYIVDNMKTHYSSEQVFIDLYDFSTSWIAYGENAILWKDLSFLFYDISDLVVDITTPEELSLIHEHLGFQKN